MKTLADFKHYISTLAPAERMPALFMGHGSPMNGIEENEYSTEWRKMAQRIPQPQAVMVISAHWYTKGTHITAMPQPRTIHDFGGFPQALFEVQYPAPGAPQLAIETKALLPHIELGLDHEWGLDHGAWTVLRHMYPEAQIPIVQLSIDFSQKPEFHFNLAQELRALRKKGVLILGSGNMVHNLRLMSWELILGGGYDWALEANRVLKSHIIDQNFQALNQYRSLGAEVQLAIPTPEHYLPLLYTLGAKEAEEEIYFFNDKAVGGSLTMTSLLIA